MRVLRSTAVILALIMMSAPKAAFGQAQSQPAAVAPEHQEVGGRRNEKESTIVRGRPPSKRSCRVIAPNSSLIVWMARPNEINRPSSRRSTRTWPPKEPRKKKR